MRYLHIIIFCFFSAPVCLKAQSEIPVISDKLPIRMVNHIDILNDLDNSYNASNIFLSNKFSQNSNKVPVFSAQDKNNIWIRFSLKNESSDSIFYISLGYANISEVNFYRQDKTGMNLLCATGLDKPFYSREDDDVDFNFKIQLPKDSSANYYLNVKSIHPVEMPVVLNSPSSLNKAIIFQTMAMSIYIGIIISILLYNLFLFFSVKDPSYIAYVLFLFTLLFAQLTYAGWSFKFLWPSHPGFNHYSVVVTSSIPGIPALVFALFFLHVKRYSTYLYKIFFFLIGCYFVIPLLCFFLPLSISYHLLDYSGIVGGLTALITSAYIARKGYRPAYYYFIAWFIFAIGRQISSIKNLGIIPYNNFTSYILYIGSAIEAILLSLALADKINILQKEKDTSQKRELAVSQENEKLIREQNVVLEEKVEERTEALQATNSQLVNTLSELKDAQLQLVEAEKMASLGQLTAGIAHEINNPINFVKSNIVPLSLDVKDLFHVIDQYGELHQAGADSIPAKLKNIDSFKKEIDLDFVKKEIKNLIKGIEEGAERTAEIVRGLRTFSRLDESELKTVNIHEGIDSTLVLLRNSTPGYIKIEKNYNADGNIECYPGKLNQVFMNILNNAVQAISGKKIKNPQESIIISTKDIENKHIEIRIKDSGPGMTDEVKQKVFDPFFTTKEVGEGTGLGMAIVFKIIEKHNGKINIVSSPGDGAEFILTLPYIGPLS